MKYRVFIKGITILSFMALISLFLLYRTGKFDPYFFDDESAMQTSPNGGKITTGTPTYDSAQQLRMASSKSMVLTESLPLKGPVKRVQVRPQQTDPFAANQARMSGSKSMVLVDNDPFMINYKKREYLSYMLIYRFTYFQDSLRRVSKPLPPSLQMMIDTMNFKYSNINWFNPK